MLEIEAGRYRNTEVKNRICCFCQRIHGIREVEDEAHFLLKCPQYKELRESLLPSDIINSNTLSDREKMIKILSQGNISKSVAKFTHQAFEDRKIGLEVMGFLWDLVSEINTLAQSPLPRLLK